MLPKKWLATIYKRPYYFCLLVLGISSWLVTCRHNAFTGILNVQKIYTNEVLGCKNIPQKCAYGDKIQFATKCHNSLNKIL